MMMTKCVDDADNFANLHQENHNIFYSSSSSCVLQRHCVGPRNCQLCLPWQCRISLEHTSEHDASLFDALTHKFTFSISAERRHTEWEADLVAHSEQLSKVNLVLSG